MTHEQVIEALKIKRECYDYAGLSCLSKESCRYCEVAMDIAIETLEKYRWIPCSERLPECEWGAETEALMYQVGDTIYTGHFGRGGLWRDEYFRGYADIKEGVDAESVIAWMPLPEPYK